MRKNHTATFDSAFFCVILISTIQLYHIDFILIYRQMAKVYNQLKKKNFFFKETFLLKDSRQNYLSYSVTVTAKIKLSVDPQSAKQFLST